MFYKYGWKRRAQALNLRKLLCHLFLACHLVIHQTTQLLNVAKAFFHRQINKAVHIDVNDPLWVSMTLPTKSYCIFPSL